MRLKITSLLDNKVTEPTLVVRPENSNISGNEWPNKPSIPEVTLKYSLELVSSSMDSISNVSSSATEPSCAIIWLFSSSTVIPLIIGIATKPSAISIACWVLSSQTARVKLPLKVFSSVNSSLVIWLLVLMYSAPICTQVTRNVSTK